MAAKQQTTGTVDYWWSHSLISDQTASGIRGNCNFSRIGPLDPHPAHAAPQTKDELCDDFCNRWALRAEQRCER